MGDAKDGKADAEIHAPDADPDAMEPIAVVGTMVDDLHDDITKAGELLPASGPITLNRWRIIDGSLGEIIAKLQGIRAVAKAAKV